MPTGAPASLPVSRFRVAWIVVAFLATTFVHAVVGRGTHGLHVIHVVFGALYLVPIVASAVWVGARPAMVLALGSAVAYLVHVRTSWAGQPTENANQLAFAAVYVFVGVAQRVLRPRLHNVKLTRSGAAHGSRAALSG